MSYLLEDLEKWASGEYDYFENLNEFKKFLKKNPEAAKRRFSPDDFEYSEDYEEARDWHYSNYKASPEERKLLAEHQRIKKQDESMAEKAQEAYRSQHEKNVKRAKRLENIGLGVGLGGAGLAALSTYSKKLPEKYRMPLGLGGIGLVAGSMIPSGKGAILENKSYEKYNQPMNDFNKRQEVRDSNIAYQKYLKNRNEHWAFEASNEFEKTAGNLKEGGLLTAGGLGLTAATLYGSLAKQKRLKEKYGDIAGVNETSILSGIGNDKASNRIYPTKEQRERAEKFRKSFNRLSFGSRVGFGVGSGLALSGASMLGNAVSKK